MEKGKPLLHWAGFLLVFVAITLMCLTAQGEKEPVKKPEKAQSDLIMINTLAAQGKLELPPVTFHHDKHTEALAKEKKGCETCHLKEDGKLSLAYMRTKTTKPAAIKDIYHANCIGCHQEDVAKGKESGPLDGFCRDCHNAKPASAVRLDAGLGKVLHYRHVESKNIPVSTADKNNCGTCHHEYDKEKKKTFYAKGKESSCRYCHLDKKKDGVQAYRQAAHEQCVLCHLDLAKKDVKENVPVGCAECHGAEALAKVAKRDKEAVAKLPNKELPRLMRGQPDAVLITYDVKNGEKKIAKTEGVGPVPFDHKAHEKYSDSCRVCHHANMDSCGQCHTLGGAKDGDFVTFEQAMHLKTGKSSCLGCHAANQNQKNCAGCHRSIVETGQPEKAACKLCHQPAETQSQLTGLTKEAKNALAENMLKARTMNPGTYSVNDIPDKVVIKELSDKYQPVELKHREHVQALLKGMKDSKLANYFHSDPGTTCQGCHHHSPLSKTPPACVSCHAKQIGKASFNTREASRPGLLAAQHGQCMSCHKDMAVKPVATACTECHKEKDKK
jgi:Class III cytochrome C family